MRDKRNPKSHNKETLGRLQRMSTKPTADFSLATKLL